MPSYKDLPFGFHRLYKEPLDADGVKSGNAGLFEYISTGSAYLGQRVLVQYDHFDLNVVLAQGKNDPGKLIPILEEFPTGYELITKNVGSHKYILVYYYNEGSAFTDKDQAYRVSDSYAMAMLYQASIFANSDTNIKYRLEYFNYLNNESSITEFTQANFVTNTVRNTVNSNSPNIILSTASEEYFFPTPVDNIGIMPMGRKREITRLWVQSDEYINAMLGV